MSNQRRSIGNTSSKATRYGLALIVILFGLSALALVNVAPTTHASSEITQATYLPSEDTYVAAGKPKDSWPTLATIWVGNNKSEGYGVQRSLLKFSIPGIPAGSTIKVAKLSLYVSATTPNDRNMTVTAARISNGWRESSNWEQYPASTIDMSDASAIEVGRTFGWYAWDIKALVQTWATEPQHGSELSIILLGYEGNEQHERGFWSKDCTTQCAGKQPVLEIQLDLPPTPTPTPTPTHTPTPNPVSLDLAYQVLTATPVTPEAASARSQATRVDVEPGDHVVYTVNYAVITTVNDAKITNQVPANVTPVAVNNDGEGKDGQITWELGTLTQGTTGAVSYEVVYAPPSTDVRIVTNPDPPTVTVGTEITFNAAVTVVPNLTYRWDFGDGNSADGPIATKTHQYTRAGLYQVTLTVSDPSCYVDATIAVVVTDNADPDHAQSALLDSATVGAMSTPLPAAHELLGLPRCTAAAPITNQGAIITWQAQQTQVQSNGLILNPVTVLYLPLISKR